MVSQWKVTRGDSQFAVPDMAGLIALVQRKELDPGDMVQPPGTEDWIYASEVPGLREHFPAASDDDDLDYRPGRSMLPIVLLGMLGAVILTAGLGVLVLVGMLPSGTEQLVGDKGLSYSQVIVTNAGMTLVDEPKANAAPGVPVAQNDALELLAKRGEFYKVRSGSAEGWIPVNRVLPMYKLGGAEVKEKYDPLFNPDHYLKVLNASWMQLPVDPRAKPDPDAEPGADTVFSFMFGNNSQYDMTDLVVSVTVKDAKKGVLGELEIPIEGIVPKNGSTMVGMIQPEKDAETPPVFVTEYSFKLLAAADPTLLERWESGLEKRITYLEFDNAQVDILQLRAVEPPK